MLDRRRFACSVRCVALAVTLGALTACAARQQVTRVAERTYRVECMNSLATCLVPMQDICREHGYDVLEGTERRALAGGSPPEGYESVKAVATVRCRQAVPLFGGDPNLPASASAGAPPAPTRPAPVSSSAPPPAGPGAVPLAVPPSAAPAPAATTPAPVATPTSTVPPAPVPAPSPSVLPAGAP